MIHLFDLDIFYKDVLVVFGDVDTLKSDLYTYHDKSVIDRIVEGMGITPITLGKTTLSIEDGVFFVWMRNTPKTAHDIGFLVHELFHAVCAVMEMVGVEPSASSEEVYAYTIGFLTEQVLDKMDVISSCLGAESEQNRQESASRPS
ncbi:MAG: hypothetical protein MJZ30_06245 [Paludibacteraceae bacterium]|nr:hypothetical protein [Paludibacteraceae bacterium]